MPSQTVTRAVRLADIITRAKAGEPLSPRLLAEEYGVTLETIAGDLRDIQLPPINLPLVPAMVHVDTLHDKYVLDTGKLVANGQ